MCGPSAALLLHRSVMDIKATDALYADLIPKLLASYSLSGCDTVAGCFGIGKTKMLDIVKQHPLSLLGEPEALLD